MVGGGQLARMTHQAAIALGQTLRVLANGDADMAQSEIEREHISVAHALVVRRGPLAQT